MRVVVVVSLDWVTVLQQHHHKEIMAEAAEQLNNLVTKAAVAVALVAQERLEVLVRAQHQIFLDLMW
jgi:hypothetical protein